MCCSEVLQCIAVCCSVLQVCCSVLQYVVVSCSVIAVCCSVCCSVLQCVAVCCSVLQRVAACCSVLQYVAVCCSVVQSVAVRVLQHVTHSHSSAHQRRRYWNTLQHTATRCNTLQHTATHCNTHQRRCCRHNFSRVSSLLNLLCGITIQLIYKKLQIRVGDSTYTLSV